MICDVHDAILFFPRLPDGKLRYKCDLCNKILNSNKAVYHHKAVYHGYEENPEILHCSFPGCNYSSHLKMNMKNHESRQELLKLPGKEGISFIPKWDDGWGPDNILFSSH